VLLGIPPPFYQTHPRSCRALDLFFFMAPTFGFSPSLLSCSISFFFFFPLYLLFPLSMTTFFPSPPDGSRDPPRPFSSPARPPSVFLLGSGVELFCPPLDLDGLLVSTAPFAVAFFSPSRPHSFFSWHFSLPLLARHQGSPPFSFFHV